MKLFNNEGWLNAVHSCIFQTKIKDSDARRKFFVNVIPVQFSLCWLQRAKQIKRNFFKSAQPIIYLVSFTYFRLVCACGTYEILSLTT